ncbi:hypothetical protein DFH06DRAFT_524976 [Mycena polygramma]|nr:hypothetical protein DFH06DRAFT_524976 [Mycena polygramma]
MDTISSTILLGQNSSSTRSFEQHAKSLIQASEANIARIESQIRDLLRLRDQERGIIASLKLAIAPVRKVPAEILAEIFLHYAALLGPVLTISQVCAHWRQVACTTPRLWTGLLQTRLTRKKRCSDTYLSTTKTFLERSSPFPIPRMTLPLANFCDPRLLDLLFSSAPRWQSLEFCDYFSARFRRMPPNTLANLTDVSIRIPRPLENHTSAVSAFLGAPQLCRVNLAVESTAHFPMPWAQLTRLTLSEISPQLSLDILLQCTNICEANFRDMEPWAVEPDSAPLVTLPQLEQLGVYFQEHVDDAIHITPFFTRLELPALAVLNLWAGWENA